MESLVHLSRVDPGFNPANLLTMRISLSPTRYDTDQKKAAFFAELLRRVESLPGVRGAAASITLPMMGFPMTPVQQADAPPSSSTSGPSGLCSTSRRPGFVRSRSRCGGAVSLTSAIAWARRPWR